MQGDAGRYQLLEHLHALPREPQLLLHLRDLLRGGRQPILQRRELRCALLAHRGLGLQELLLIRLAQGGLGLRGPLRLHLELPREALQLLAQPRHLRLDLAQRDRLRLERPG